MKRTSAFILSLIMVFSAVSCDRTGTSSGTSETISALKAEVIKSDKNHYLNELPLPEKSGSVLSAAPIDSGKYIVAFRSIENVVPGFYTTDADFSEYTLCDTGIEFRENAEISVRFACAADGTLYAAVTEITHGGIPPYNYLASEQNAEDFDWNTYEANTEYYYSVYKFSPAGKAVSKTEITGMDDNEIRDFAVCGGKLYLYCGVMYTADETNGQAEEYQLSDGVAGGIALLPETTLSAAFITGQMWELWQEIRYSLLHTPESRFRIFLPAEMNLILFLQEKPESTVLAVIP